MRLYRGQMDEEEKGESVKDDDTKTTGATVDEDERSESVTGGLQQEQRGNRRRGKR